MFKDFSSAFLSSILCKFILDFLTNREQRVDPLRINDILSTVLSISTGAPQGCVLSAILYIIYTNELRSRFTNCHLIKYADDTVIVGLISNNDESEYNLQISEVVQWCKANNLLLNAAKTKELMFDYRHCNICHVHVPLSIDNATVAICDNFIKLLS